MTDSFVGVGNRRRDHVRAAGPLAEINQRSGRCKRKVCVRGLRRLLADRQRSLMERLRGIKNIAERYQAVKNQASYQGIALAMP